MSSETQSLQFNLRVGAGSPCPVILSDCNWREFLLWLGRRRYRFRVQGDSMLPLLREGEEVLIAQYAYQHHPPQVGDVVVAQHPQKPPPPIIKRVAMVYPDDTYVLHGDNWAASSDSRQFGPVARSLILGRVTCRFG